MILEKHLGIRILRMSDVFSNKGTNRYFRMYVEVEREERQE